MTTEKQHTANRANAQHSTGPVTPEGKAASSLNGTTHGLSSHRISPRDPAAQARLRAHIDEYTRHFRPQGPIERDLIADLATARTRISLIEDRMAQLEAEGLAPEAPPYQVLARYLREAHRVYTRSRTALETARTHAARYTLAAANASARLATAEVKVPEPVRSELASLRQALCLSLRRPPEPPPPPPDFHPARTS